MIDRARMKYNPAFLSDEELMSSFVVREAERDLVIDAVRHNSASSSNQHLLVVGPRGIGKTTLVRCVAAEVRADTELSKSWYPLTFAEEAYSVSTPGELWLEALFHLAEQTQSDRWKGAYEELRREPDELRLRERALARLMDFADEEGKRILLIVENFDTLFVEATRISAEDAWVLRHTLQNEPRLALLATTKASFSAVTKPSEAFYDMFRTIELKPLTDDQSITLWASLTGSEPDRQRIRPIKILTGGNPRLLAVIATFAAQSSFRDLMNDLTQLIDQHTDYFKDHLDYLPAQGRKVFVALLDLWDPATAGEVAVGARLGVNAASAQLRRLEEQGAVTSIEESRGKKRYQVVERMYNIYYLMRRRGHPSNRVRAIVDFMVHFYEGEDLVRVAGMIAREAVCLSPELRSDHCLAFEAILKYPAAQLLREKILEAAPAEFLTALQVSTRQDSGRSKDTKEAVDLTARALVLLKSDIPQAEEAFRQAIAIAPEHGPAWMGLSLTLSKLGRSDEAEKCGLKALEIAENMKIDTGRAGARYTLGVAASIKKQYHEAEHWYDQALEIYRRLEREKDVAAVYSAVGEMARERGRADEAESWYHKALEIYEKLKMDEEIAVLSCGFASLFQDQYLWERAEEHYLRALSIYTKSNHLRGQAYVYYALGDWARDQQHWNQAEQHYRRALDAYGELHSQRMRANLFFAIGSVIVQQDGRFDEAEEFFRRASDIDTPERAYYSFSLARFLAVWSRWDEALPLTPLVLSDAAAVADYLAVITNYFVDAAAEGYGEQALRQLLSSPGVSLLEPLVCALQLHLGMKVNKAQEIVEVAKDIVQKIRDATDRQESTKRNRKRRGPSRARSGKTGQAEGNSTEPKG